MNCNITSRHSFVDDSCAMYYIDFCAKTLVDRYFKAQHFNVNLNTNKHFHLKQTELLLIVDNSSRSNY